MTIASASYRTELASLPDTALLGAAPYHYDKSQQGAYPRAQLIKALANLQLLASSFRSYFPAHMTRSSRITLSIGAMPVLTATTATDASYDASLKVEELSELSLPRLALSVQSVSASFVLREPGAPHLVGGSDIIAS